MFDDRRQAGRELAKRLFEYRGKDTVVLSIPRGGVVVAEEVAKKLKAKLDLIISRKIGAPGDPEFAIGAVSPDRSFVVNERVVREMEIPKEYIDRTVRIESIEISRRMEKYRGSQDFHDVRGKNVIVVDDGIATGYTMKVVVEFLKRMKARKIIVAVPVAPADTIEKLKRRADEVIVLDAPWDFHAIGQYYRSFPQVSDEEVIKIMRRR